MRGPGFSRGANRARQRNGQALSHQPGSGPPARTGSTAAGSSGPQPLDAPADFVRTQSAGVQIEFVVVGSGIVGRGIRVAADVQRVADRSDVQPQVAPRLHELAVDVQGQLRIGAAAVDLRPGDRHVVPLRRPANHGSVR